jgi:hypothetical protein
MMALGALHPNAEEELGGRFGQIVRIAVDTEVVGRAVGVDRPLPHDEFADELIERPVGAERLADPVVQGPHPLLAQGLALVADQVGPLERPQGGVLVVVGIELRVAGQAQESVDEMLPLVRIVGVEERLEGRIDVARAEIIALTAIAA